jgi:serine/threonine-protein kinase
VVGLEQDEAIDQLETAGFTGSTSTDQVDSLEPEGTVVSIDPDEGTAAAPDAAFRLGISTGTISLPDVGGLTEAAARQELIAAGLDNALIVAQQVERDDVPQGTVVGTEPGAGSSVAAGDEVTLLVAVPVPGEPTPTTTAPTTSEPSTTAPPTTPSPTG